VNSLSAAGYEPVLSGLSETVSARVGDKKKASAPMSQPTRFSRKPILVLKLSSDIMYSLESNQPTLISGGRPAA